MADAARVATPDAGHSRLKCYKTEEPPSFERLLSSLLIGSRFENRLQNRQNVT